MQRELVERARSGDLDAFSSLVRASHPRLHTVANTGGTTGIVLLDSAATPVLMGNTVCDNEVNLRLQGGAPMPDLSGNDIGPDDVDMASE